MSALSTRLRPLLKTWPTAKSSKKRSIKRTLIMIGSSRKTGHHTQSKCFDHSVGCRWIEQWHSCVPASMLEHDPEKWVPVFGKDHAQTKSYARRSLSMIRVCAVLLAVLSLAAVA